MSREEVCFSVIVPTWEPSRRGLLLRALESIGNQTYPASEVIVMNNNPANTGLKDVLKEKGGMPDSVELIVRDELNLSPHEARNRVFADCCFEYIATLDDDDWWSVGYLKRVAELLRTKSADVVVSGYRNVLEDFSEVSVFIPQTQFSFEKVCLANQGYVMSNLVFSAEGVAAVRGLDESMATSADKGLVIDVEAFRHRYEVIQEVLVEKMIGHSTSWSRYPNKWPSAVGFYRKYRHRMGMLLKVKYWASRLLKQAMNYGMFFKRRVALIVWS